MTRNWWGLNYTFKCGRSQCCGLVIPSLHLHDIQSRLCPVDEPGRSRWSLRGWGSSPRHYGRLNLCAPAGLPPDNSSPTHTHTHTTINHEPRVHKYTGWISHQIQKEKHEIINNVLDPQSRDKQKKNPLFSCTQTLAIWTHQLRRNWEPMRSLFSLT